MFHIPYMLTWSIISFLSAVTLYLELQRFGDSLYHAEQVLLSRFPVSSNPFSGEDAYYVTRENELSYFTLKVLSKIFFSKCTNTQSKKNIFPDIFFVSVDDQHQDIVESTKGGVLEDRLITLPMCLLEDNNTDNMCYWPEERSHSNASFCSPNKSGYLSCHFEQIIIPSKAAVEYPMIVANQSQIYWEEWLFFGMVFAGFLGIIHTCLYMCKHKLSLKSAAIEKSSDQITIPIELLQFFKEHFELVVEQKNIHFKRSQQYYKTGLRVNLEKNILSAENKALKRELTCLKAKLTNQRFYIEILEKSQTFLTKRKKICNHESENCYTSFDQSQSTLVEELRSPDLCRSNFVRIIDETTTCQLTDECHNGDKKQDSSRTKEDLLGVINKRFNEVFFPGGRLPYYRFHPIIHWKLSSNFHGLVPGNDNTRKPKVTTSKSYHVGFTGSTTSNLQDTSSLSADDITCFRNPSPATHSLLATQYKTVFRTGSHVSLLCPNDI